MAKNRNVLIVIGLIGTLIVGLVIGFIVLGKDVDPNGYAKQLCFQKGYNEFDEFCGVTKDGHSGIIENLAIRCRTGNQQSSCFPIGS